MTSAIDATKPLDNVPAVKADLRANLAAAKSEIELLQDDVSALQAVGPGQGNWRSVKAFGAVGNGATNDTAAIQACIDAGPGFVYIPAGTYQISASLNLRANVTVQGEFGGTILRATANSNINGLFVSSGAIPLFGIRDLRINMNRAQQAGFPGTSVGIRLAHASTSAAFGGELNDAYGRLENIVIEAVDGDGMVCSGSACHCINITVIGCHGKGIQTSMNDASWWDCTVGGCAEEGWLCFAGSGRYYGCKAFFVGTGQNPNTGTYGNYNLGVGFRITNGNQFFIGCEGQDTDGPAFLVQGGRVLLSGCYASQASNLTGTSANINQNPIRGGGWTGQRSGFEVRNNNGCVIQGLVRDRLIDIGGGANAPNLDCAVQLTSSSGNLINVGGDTRAIKVGGVWVQGNNGTSIADDLLSIA